MTQAEVNDNPRDTEEIWETEKWELPSKCTCRSMLTPLSAWPLGGNKSCMCVSVFKCFPELDYKTHSI